LKHSNGHGKLASHINGGYGGVILDAGRKSDGSGRKIKDPDGDGVSNDGGVCWGSDNGGIDAIEGGKNLGQIDHGNHMAWGWKG